MNLTELNLVCTPKKNFLRDERVNEKVSFVINKLMNLCPLVQITSSRK